MLYTDTRKSYYPSQLWHVLMLYTDTRKSYYPSQLWHVLMLFTDTRKSYYPPWLCFFCCFTSQVNSYGYGRTGSSPNHTLFWASLNKLLTSTPCTYFRLYLTTTFLEWFSGREENDCRNYFMINLHKSMGPGLDRTHDPWICNQTRICCQTRY